MKFRLYCSVLCLVWGLSGCALATKSVSQNQEQDALKVVEVLRYFRFVQQLSSQELHRQYVIRNDQYKRVQNDTNRLMLAILLTIPQTPFHDTARAVKILSESTVSRPRYDSSLQELSSLLLHLLAEQKVQEARNARVLKQLNTTLEEKNKKEHQHKMTSQRLSETLSRMKDQEVRNDQLDKELGKERARVETLQNKIEQLKLIEKSIIDRKSPKEPTT